MFNDLMVLILIRFHPPYHNFSHLILNFFLNLFAIVSMYPIKNPTIGNIIITSNVNLNLMLIKQLKIMIVMGSLNSISKVH